MRYLLVVLSIGLLSLGAARAEVSVSVGVAIPGVSIGINVPAYPRLVRVPGYPVYYDPRIRLNLFFYDGLYWVFHGDHWYVSSWYDGPWELVDPNDVPVYVLRVPVRYYRLPPPYFRGWHPERPPRWDEHWGPEWKERRGDWDRDHRPPPPPAPRPSYQRQYSGDRYPHEPERQYIIRQERYRYEPRDPMAQKHYEKRWERGGHEGKGKDKGRGEHGADR